MEITNDYRFWVSVSTLKFDHKPNRETEVGKIRFQRIYPTIGDFAELISKGYCYAPVFNDATFCMNEKTDANFMYSSFVSIDIDHATVDMNTMVDGLEYKPTIAYTSCSNGLDDKYSYRLIYCFADKIEGTREYSNYVYAILSSNQISIDAIDRRSLKASQYYNGNGCGNININISNIIYNKIDFIDYYKNYFTNITDTSSNESINLTHIHTPPTNMSYNDTFENDEFKSDFWSMRMEDILSKYVDIYPNYEHTPLPTVDDDTPFILLPKDYLEIKRFWTCKDNGRAIKIKDGQGRRRKLFLNGIIRRLINPNISFDNLLYNLLYELVQYVSNFDAQNVIGKKEIYDIASCVMKKDITKYEWVKGVNRKFIVNPSYCEKYGLNKRQVRNMACKMLHNDCIGELYDCSKTDKENLEVMKENGLEISPITLKRWRKENGITKYKKNA